MNITEEMVERGAQALWYQEGDEHTLLEFEAIVGHNIATEPFRQLARMVLQAALWGPADESVEERAKRIFAESESYTMARWDHLLPVTRAVYRRVAQTQLDEQNKDV